MEFRLLMAGGFVFFAVILGGCGVLGDPIPYTQTESYRNEQKAQQAPPAKSETPARSEKDKAGKR